MMNRRVFWRRPPSSTIVGSTSRAQNNLSSVGRPRPRHPLHFAPGPDANMVHMKGLRRDPIPSCSRAALSSNV